MWFKLLENNTTTFFKITHYTSDLASNLVHDLWTKCGVQNITDQTCQTEKVDTYCIIMESGLSDPGYTLETCEKLNESTIECLANLLSCPANIPTWGAIGGLVLIGTTCLCISLYAIAKLHAKFKEIDEKQPLLDNNVLPLKTYSSSNV